MTDKKIKEFDTTIFLEEIRKRVSVDESQLMEFLSLWEFKTFKRNEFISSASEIPRFSIFVLKGCLRQYTVSDKGDETIVYFAEEKHFIGDLPNMRSKTASGFYFQAIEPCELLTLSAENWQKAFVQFPWWTDAHLTGYQKWTASLQQQIAEMNIKTGEERYLKLLNSRPKLFQRVPQHFIASYLGISPETLSRIRKKIFNI
ncbi:MAG: Crp/Fnr family transcriptional regulator [Sphingobacteriales bacterium]|nr:MAG: Crp/Fnr family transcriptional regulator [Sphingobacteriales bacterium]